MTWVAVAIANGLILSPPITSLPTTDTYTDGTAIAYYFSTFFQRIYPHNASVKDRTKTTIILQVGK